MHPELLNSGTFIRYYKEWQGNPESIVFAPIAEMFLMYGMTEDAIKICREGVKRYPRFISGRLALAKAYIAKSEWNTALEELNRIFEIVPRHPVAIELASKIRHNIEKSPKEVPETPLKYDIFDDENEITEEVDIAAYIDEREKALDFDDGVQFKSWSTITMARIFASQGYYDRALRIYDTIVERDPGNEAALNELSKLKEKMGGC